jgi:hypothetical protein
MCSYLLEKADDKRTVLQFRLTLLEANVWLNLADGSKSTTNPSPKLEELCIVDMDYSGTADQGYLSTWGQTGCTVVMAIQTVGRKGCWAYFAHVNSSMVTQGVERACDAVSELANLDDITFVIMGGPGGQNVYVDYLKRIRLQGNTWRFIALEKPENGAEESVLDIANCCLALTTNLVGVASNKRMQFQGFHPDRVPLVPREAAPVVTGHRALDAQLRSTSHRAYVWINLSVECNAPPQGMPDDPTNGVRWIMNEDNLVALITALKKQTEFKSVDPHAAAKLLHKYLLRLPE